MAFAEHSGHLYFDRDTYWGGSHLVEGIDGAKDSDSRINDYFTATSEAGCANGCVGLEVDCDFKGRPVIRPEDRSRVSFLIGAVHQLPSLRDRQSNSAKLCEEFLSILQRFSSTGIQVLAHPFRVFRRAGLETPVSLLEPTVKLLRETGVAAEINFHTNEPPAEFARLCMDANVKLTLGSDAHNLYEVGEFAPHLELLRSCGFDGDLKDIIIDPRI
jgi:histidinol phosphatase-like PHP family hydrolase